MHKLGRQLQANRNISFLRPPIGPVNLDDDRPAPIPRIVYRVVMVVFVLAGFAWFGAAFGRWLTQ